MDNPIRDRPQVLIVGAGPVGLALACELHRHGVPCRIIDQNEGPTDQSRALGVHARTIEVFDDMGIAGRVLDEGRKLHGVNAVADGRRVVHLSFNFDGLDTPYPFVLSLPQGQTERILIDHLGALGGRVERRLRLEGLTQADDGITATLADADGRTSEARASWLIGCDGARSAVRHALAIPFEGGEYEEAYLLADVRLRWDAPEDEAQIVLRPEGPLAAFPYAESGRWRLIDLAGDFQSDDPARVAEHFRAVLHAHGHPEAKLDDPYWVSLFRIHRRIADDFRLGRCFLAGDAAHIHSPVGGQGMNTGIQDAYNLAWKLALVIRGQGRPGLLDSYTAERRPVAAEVVRQTDLATRFVTLRNPVAESIRNHLVAILSEFEFVRRRVSHAISELAIDYRRSPIVAEDHGSLTSAVLEPALGTYLGFAAAPHAGDRVPDFVLSSTPGRLFDLLRGTRHTLLIFGAGDHSPGAAQQIAAVEEVARGFGDRIDIVPIADAEELLHRRFGASAPCLYLIRPDGYIGYRSLPPDAERLGVYLNRIFV